MSTTTVNPIRRRTAVGLVAGLASLGLVTGAGVGASATPSATPVPASVPAASASTGALTYSGQAFGTRVTAGGDTINTGPTSIANVGCTQTAGLNNQNSIAGVDIPGLADVGVIENTLKTTSSSTVAESSIAGLSLFEGEVEVGAIETTASATRSSTGRLSNNVAFDIASLKVGDNEIELTGREQTIDVAGIAQITVNKKTSVTNSSGTSGSGAALTVKVLETGAVAEIGFASATVNTGAPAGLVGGQAFGSQARLAGTVVSGPTARITTPCLGTGGKGRVNEIAGIDLGSGLGSVSGVRSTVTGSTSPTPTSTTTSEIADVSLLGGTVRIEGVDVTAKAWRDNRGRVFTESSTDVASVRVAGVEIDLPESGTGSVNLPGVGTLDIGKAKKSANGVGVTGLRLTLLDGTADITLGYAEAQAKRP